MLIDYNGSKKSFIDFLKGNDTFKDYNFTGSNINVLLDVLSRNTHMYGFYGNMISRESSPKTAQHIDSLKGYASRHSYLIQTYNSAIVKINLEIKNPKSDYIYVPKNTKFSTTNEIGRSVTFITPIDYTLRNKDSNGNIIGEIICREGELITDLIEVDTNTKYYKIDDENVDISTLLVDVKNSISSLYSNSFTLMNPNVLPNSTDFIYYLSLKGNSYNLYFGDDVFGYQPKSGEYIKLQYIKTIGENGNGCSDFNLLRRGNIKDKTIIDYYDSVSCFTQQSSSGGVSGINIDNLKMALSSYSRVKSIAINDDDYKSVILSNFGDISSIAVWGGERNNNRQYGKIFISIKPKYANTISIAYKETIKNFLIQNYSLISENIVFVDPIYLLINITIIFKKNLNSQFMDGSEITSNLFQKTQEYNSEHLGKFEKTFVEQDYIKYISSQYESMYSNLYIKKELQYELSLIYGNDREYTFNFNNPLLTFKSNKFKIGNNEAYYMYDKDSQNISSIYLYIDGKRFENYGTVNLDTGEVTIKIPNTLNDTSITLYASPYDSSIESSFDRILQINNINVEVK